MAKISIANLKKTIYYLQRNGLRDTYLAALERLQEKKSGAIGMPEQCRQTEAGAVTEENAGEPAWVRFSILVPTYRTDEKFLRDMVDSVLHQTYGNLELILADASGDDSVSKVIATYKDDRIVYLPLRENGGISANTNAALQAATGDYIGLLDHDDVLTEDALYEMAKQIDAAHRSGVRARILYSDEDKCDQTGTIFYEPHRKEKFNLDLIMSNNYICHFLVMEAELMKKTGFRKEFDGAQDFDLVLQAVAEISGTDQWRQQIIHIPRILYHWRCHQGSTAVNPRSKMYAYDAGRRAVQAFLDREGWQGKVSDLRHLGFYRVDYEPDVFTVRSDIGAVGGPIYGRNNKITGGIYTTEGVCPYAGLRRGFSGYMHKGVLQQEAWAVDIRHVVLREDLRELYKEVTGLEYAETAEFTDRQAVCYSLRLADKIHEKGYRILWDPGLVK